MLEGNEVKQGDLEPKDLEGKGEPGQEPKEPIKREERFIPKWKVDKLVNKAVEKALAEREVRPTPKPQFSQEELDGEVEKLSTEVEEKGWTALSIKRFMTLIGKGLDPSSFMSGIKEEHDKLKGRVNVLSADITFEKEWRELLSELESDEVELARANKEEIRQLAHTRRIQSTPLDYIFARHKREFQSPKKKSGEGSKPTMKVEDTDLIKDKTFDEIMDMEPAEQKAFVASLPADSEDYDRFTKKLAKQSGWHRPGKESIKK